MLRPAKAFQLACLPAGSCYACHMPATLVPTFLPSFSRPNLSGLPPQVIYIAPLKALVRERIKDWGSGFCTALGKRMVELTGDYTPDMVGMGGRARPTCWAAAGGRGRADALAQ